MYIHKNIGKRNRRGTKVFVVADAETRRHIEITIFRHDHGRCHWLTVWLNPKQAVKLANFLLNPSKSVWVDFADPAPAPAPQGEHRETWQVIKATCNGVHPAWIAVKGKELAISHWGYGRSQPVGVTDYFHAEHSEVLSTQECKLLVGLLFHWAGAMMIGYKTKRIVKKKPDLMLAE